MLVLILFWLSQTWPVTLRYRSRCFSGCTVPPDSKQTDLGSSNQESSPSAGKNTGVVLVPYLCMEVHPYSFFQWCGYFWCCWVSFITTDEFSVRVSENQTLLSFLLCVRQTWMTQSAFTCNRDETSSQNETHLGMKKFLFTCEFHPGMKRVEFHPWLKFNLKENLPLSMMETIKFIIFLSYWNQKLDM